MGNTKLVARIGLIAEGYDKERAIRISVTFDFVNFKNGSSTQFESFHRYYEHTATKQQKSIAGMANLELNAYVFKEDFESGLFDTMIPDFSVTTVKGRLSLREVEDFAKIAKKLFRKEQTHQASVNMATVALELAKIDTVWFEAHASEKHRDAFTAFSANSFPSLIKTAIEIGADNRGWQRETQDNAKSKCA